MFTMFKTIGALGAGEGTSVVPCEAWGDFLVEFSKTHTDWLTILETKDHGTSETVQTPDAVLESVELDLEDERHPRINVTVRDDNKTFNIFSTCHRASSGTRPTAECGRRLRSRPSTRRLLFILARRVVRELQRFAVAVS